MKLMLELWFITFALEGLLFSNPLWRFRRQTAAMVALVIAFSSGWLLYRLGAVVGLGFGMLAVFRILNMLRVVKNRMHEQYLRQATGRTSVTLLLFHILLLAGLITLWIVPQWQLVTVSQLLVTGTILAITIKNVTRLGYRQPATFLPDHELPTVTVAIPARNETRDLQECLRSVLASDYPKLEILVLDDCSQGKTADIIKSFAQDGVRFVQGNPPADRWLAKNQAYQQLLDEANGDLMLFCGVDVRIGPQTIRSMVNVLIERQKSMMSVLPVRSQSSPRDAFIQPMRYWWELALPRRLFNKPPVLSTCWLIKRDVLEDLGGFAAVSHAILPEAYFARELVHSDGYSFLRSGGELKVETAKRFKEQYATAVRNRYPQIRRRPEWALGLTAFSLVFLLGPFVLLAASFWVNSISTYPTGATCILLIITHVLIVNTTDPANSLLALISFPIAAASELIIGNTSMLQYEFFTISWKDRNVCIPVMHVIPKLPPTAGLE